MGIDMNAYNHEFFVRLCPVGDGAAYLPRSMNNNSLAAVGAVTRNP